MTRRRRLKRKLLWAGVLLGLVLLRATLALLRSCVWARRLAWNLTPIRTDEAIKARTALVVVVVSVLAVTVGAGVTMAGGDEQWQKALQLRSDALNRQHGVGEYARTPSASKEQAWLTALLVRSEALNRQYGLGTYARELSVAKQPARLEALMIRSDALNRQHKLGAYAPGS